jgi:hypothetical protein
VVHDAGGVSRGEPFADREVELENRLHGTRLAAPPACSDALDVFHRDIQPLIVDTDLIDHDDVRMRQPRER